MTEAKMNEMAAYYEKEAALAETEEISLGVAIAIVMLDELVHQVLPDGSISHCGDLSCPCWTEQEDGGINLSAHSVAEDDDDAWHPPYTRADAEADAATAAYYDTVARRHVDNRLNS